MNKVLDILDCLMYYTNIIEEREMFKPNTLLISVSGKFAVEIKFANADGTYTTMEYDATGNGWKPRCGNYITSKEKIVSILNETLTFSD